jgi:hypothetical protein
MRSVKDSYLGDTMPATKQVELPNMPGSALSRYAQDFIDQRKRIDEEKEKLTALGMKIVGWLKEEGRRSMHLKIETIDGVEHYTFAVEETKEKLKVSKG